MIQDVIIEGSDQGFVKDVIEPSMKCPILVDFWAPWCGPCKQLTPILEKLVTAMSGAVRLVKINMDRNPAIASQLQVRSIPAVFAFFQGQAVDGFMGALPESELQTFINKLVAHAGGEADSEFSADHAAALQQINTELAQMRAENRWDLPLMKQWQDILADILVAMPKNNEIISMMGQLCLDCGDVKTAQSIMQMHGSDDALLQPLQKRLALIADAPDLPKTVPQWQEGLDLKHYQAQYDYATALCGVGKMHEAAEILCALIQQSRKLLEESARKYLISMMAALQQDDPRIAIWRKRLSALLFS